LRDSSIKEIIITDTIPLPPHKHLPNLKVLSVAPLLAEAIRRINSNESISTLIK